MSKLPSRRPRGLAMCFALALLVLASTCDNGVSPHAIPVPTEERPGVLNTSVLRFSLSSTREDGQELEGSTLQGSVAIFFEAPDVGNDIAWVDFFLDDPTRTRPPMTRDALAPFDFLGAARNGQAILYDTRKLADGSHSITVVVHFARYYAEEATASFTVANTSGPEPEPMPEPMPVPRPPPGLRTVDEWERLFRNAWRREHVTNLLPRSRSKDSWDFYGLAYGIDGNTAMYRATGRTEYLDRAVLYANNMVNTARRSSSLPQSQFKDGFLGWPSMQSDPGGQEVPLYESYCWRYVTRLLRVIRETPQLYGNTGYRSTYERLLAFTEKNIFEKWYVRGAESYIYRNRTHMAAHWASIAMDLMLMTEDDIARPIYRAVFDNINQGMPNGNASLRTQLEPHPLNRNAWFWSDEWGSRARPGQDVAHANGVLAFVVEAHDAGLTWTTGDLRRFGETLDTIIWREEGRYAKYVDGSGRGDGWFNDGLMKLGRYDIALQRRLEQHRVGRNGQFFANGALNVRLLSEARGP